MFFFCFFFAEAIYKRQDDSVYFYFPELSIRKDGSGYTAITVSKTSQLIGITDGLCGNANGDPAGNSNGGEGSGEEGRILILEIELDYMKGSINHYYSNYFLCYKLLCKIIINFCLVSHSS